MATLTTACAALIVGLATGLGPCALPRYALLAPCLVEPRRSFVPFALIAGVLCGTLTLGFLGISAGFVARASHVAYAGASVALILSGVLGLRASPCRRLSVVRIAMRGTLGGAFLAGASSVLVGSPCCTPLFLAIGASLAAAEGRIWPAFVGFLAGQTLPIVAATWLGRVLSGRLVAWHHALRAVNAGVALAIGCYYGLLA